MDETQFRHITCRSESGVLVITVLDDQVQGDDSVEGFRRELLEASVRFPAKKWVLDFKHTGFFSTAGMRPLLSLHRKLQPDGGRIVLCNLRPELVEVFQVTRLVSSNQPGSTPFELARDVSDAMHRLRHHSQKVENGILVFTFTDDLLHGDPLATELGEELQMAVDESGVLKVVLDFTRVRSISTLCMKPLLHLRSQLKEKEGRVVMANLSEQVAEILSVTRLIAPNPSTPGLFESFADTAAALRALR
jgi:anti-sigma B factor antagonist